MRKYNFDDLLNPGDFMYYSTKNFEYAGIYYCCPCGCGVISVLPFCDRQINWNWDGNEDYPSVTPSILKQTPGICKGWHGYLTKGKFIEC